MNAYLGAAVLLSLLPLAIAGLLLWLYLRATRRRLADEKALTVAGHDAD